ncbi:MAG: DEAD/DEAH box helicase family protein [bacterium]|nr:DEAD/DEAH box helicase family protein [bacterium]
MQKEAKARIKINKLLEQSGWRFFDDASGKTNIVLENNTKLTKKMIDEFGEDFEKVQQGYIDYLLLDNDSFPLAILEAKSEDNDPLIGKEKARRYAHSINARFIILSNGNLHYFWDLDHGNPVIISTFPTPESIKFHLAYRPNPKQLADEKVESDYIVLSQYQEYQRDPRWTDETKRTEFIAEKNLKFLRPYQLQAIYALQNAAKTKNTRYLFEMATGTGKTLVAAAIIKLFLRTGNAKRVLFLVDRLELEDQAKKNFIRWLKNDYTTVVYKENRDDWKKAEIVVTTVQSLLFNNKYLRLFSPTDFDLVISDEAHRSIGGNSRAVFEYFLGYKLGLTATPKDYLKNLNPTTLNSRDPREWERRLLLDTYNTFGCESGIPTFRYSLVDAVRDGYLVNPTVADARTEITTQLLSDKGYSVVTTNPEGDEEEATFIHKDFERKFYSDKTNRIFCKTFLKNAIKDPISGEIGKTIMFCVSRKHAKKITQILNEFAEQVYPGKYQSDFAIQVTSDIPDAQQFSINFANNNLNGTTRFLEDYKSSRTRVCVTVGMMTTGYDCEDILNLCMLRPIFSPTDFIQMKGRGTRKYQFKYKKPDENIGIDKDRYKLFDFFANCEYFEVKYNYDEIIKLPIKQKKGSDIDYPLTTIPDDKYTSIIPDPLKTLTETPIGVRGMKIDRMFFQRFETQIRNDPVVSDNFIKGKIDIAEEHIKANIFDKPEDYINLDKIRKALNLDRRVTLREVLEKIFGRLDRFKTKDELLEEEFDKFINIYKPESQYVMPIKNFLKAYITDAEIREIIDKREYSRLATNPKVSIGDIKSLSQWKEVIPGYVKDYVSLNIFM